MTPAGPEHEPPPLTHRVVELLDDMGRVIEMHAAPRQFDDVAVSVRFGPFFHLRLRTRLVTEDAATSIEQWRRSRL